MKISIKMTPRVGRTIPTKVSDLLGMRFYFNTYGRHDTTNIWRNDDDLVYSCKYTRTLYLDDVQFYEIEAGERNSQDVCYYFPASQF